MSRPSLLMPVLAVLLCGARTQEPDTDTLIRLDVGNTSSLHHLSPRVVKLRLVGEFEGLYLNVSVGEGALGSLSQIVEQLTATYRIPAAESRRLKHFLFIEFASAEIDWAQDRLSVEPGEPSRASGQSGLQRLTEALEILVEQHESETQTLERRLLKVSKVVVDQKSAFRDQLRAHREEVSTLRRKMSAFEAESTQITAHRPKSVARFDASVFSFNDYMEYAARGEPFVLTGLPLKWISTWDHRYVSEICGNATVTTKTRRHNSKAWAEIEAVGNQSLGQFVSAVFESAPGDPHPLYVHDESIPRTCPHLLEEFSVPELFSCCDVFQHLSLESQLPSCLKHLQNYWPSLFIGGAGTSSGCHADFLDTSFWMVVLEGSKNWTIVNRTQADLLFPRSESPHKFQMQGLFTVSPNQSQTKMLHAMQFAENFVDHWNTILQAGELIFIPAGSPHEVMNLESTLAISQNFVDAANGRMFLKRFLEDSRSGLTNLDSKIWSESFYQDVLSSEEEEIRQVEKAVLWSEQQAQGSTS